MARQGVPRLREEGVMTTGATRLDNCVRFGDTECKGILQCKWLVLLGER